MFYFLFQSTLWRLSNRPDTCVEPLRARIPKLSPDTRSYGPFSKYNVCIRVCQPIMSVSGLLIVPLVFLTSFCATYVLVPLVGKIATRFGIVDQPGARRLHRLPVPRIGGAAVFLGFHLSCALIFLMPGFQFTGMFTVQSWLVFLAASTLLVAVGLVDDIRGVKPLTKLLCQAAAASIMFLAGVSAGQIFGMELPLLINLAATILWFVAIINAFNLIDGMDGLAAGLASIAALGIIGSLLFRHLPGDALIMVAFLGACVAFLRFNFNPASIFLGDTGSMFLGFTVSAISLGTSSKGTLLASIGVPLLAIGIPIFDTLLAIWRRSVRRAFPELTGRQAGGVMHFDMDHLHHRLIRSGLTQRRVALMLYFTNAMLVFVGLASLLFAQQAWGIFVIAFVVGAYVIARHVAYVELWDSGVALIEGFRAPSNPVLAVLLYPIVDLVLLAGAFLTAVLVCSIGQPAALPLSTLLCDWFFATPVVCGVPFITLFLTQTYSRVWSRARIGEFVFLAFSVCAGVLLAWGAAHIIPLGGHVLSAAEWMLYGSLALAFITGIRGLPRAMNDVLSFVGRKLASSQPEATPNVIVYGAGYRGILYLSLLSRDSVKNRSPKAQAILGLIDDDRNLRGRFVHGYRVLGGLRDLIASLRSGKVREVVLTAPLSEKRLARLKKICQETRTSLFEWKPVSRCLVAAISEVPAATRAVTVRREPVPSLESGALIATAANSEPAPEPIAAHG